MLSNIRVLAIDQAPKEKDGQNTVVGKTVTLELKPEQAETLAAPASPARCRWRCAASPISTWSTPSPDDQGAKRGDNINVIRFGIPSQTTTQK